MRVAFATEPGSEHRQNEDAVAASAHVVAVVDGVTAPSGMDTGCIHGTPWYANNLASHIVAVVAEAPRIDLRTALFRALAKVAASHCDTCDLASDGTPSGTVAILREANQTLDYLVLSDASVMVETGSGVVAIADRRVDELVRDLATAAKVAPVGTEERQARLAELVTEQRKLRNVAGGYWLAGAVPEAAEYALTGEVPLSDTRRAAVMTDGASSLVDLYEQLTWDQAPDELALGGPARWIERVRRVEDADPDATKWRRFKRGDDATVAYVEF
jgi:hypothetical protein